MLQPGNGLPMMRTPKRRTTIPVKYPAVASPSTSRATSELAPRVWRMNSSQPFAADVRSSTRPGAPIDIVENEILEFNALHGVASAGAGRARSAQSAHREQRCDRA